MKTTFALIRRNRKLFFKDKGMLFTSLVTPLILIVLYATFLANVYRDSFRSSLPEFMEVSDKLINGTVAGQLVAALLAVSCITVSFCVNLTMVSDRVSGAIKDFAVAPVEKSKIAFGYFVATVLNSLMVNLVALVLGLIYMATMGWYLGVTDVLLILVDLIVLVLFGASISSIVCYPLKTQGQLSGVSAIISAGYGFICGAYMPISNFGEGLQKALKFLPGTYGTSMLKNHALAGVFAEMEETGFPSEVVDGIAASLDCRISFHGNVVGVGQMMLIMVITVVVFIALYIGCIAISEKKH